MTPRTVETRMIIPPRIFEHGRQPVIPRRRFIRRMFIVIGLWLVLTIIGLIIGIAGYAIFEGMSLVDAYVNAAMILSGSNGRIEDDSRKNLRGYLCNLLWTYHCHRDRLSIGADLSSCVAPFPCRNNPRKGLRRTGLKITFRSVGQ